MKIAFVGNMNNNNFAMMRYFRDLGADAHLLLCRNDGEGSLSHFRPELDTWAPHLWSDYIHNLNFDNSSTAVLGNPLKLKIPPTKRQMRKELSGYDIYIGSGATPAIFGRLGLQLTVFYPYATGIEHVATHEYESEYNKWLIKRPVLSAMKRRQISGIRRAGICINSELGLTESIFRSLGVKTTLLPTPQIYNEGISGIQIPEHLQAFARAIESTQFSVFSHMRHLWRRPPRLTDDSWFALQKNNDWLITGFVNFRNSNPELNTKLFLVEYGKDVKASKQLISDLGATTDVIWLPIMPRRELLVLLELADVGVGEFNTCPNMIWGGTAWESLAVGKPTMQTLNFTPRFFEERFKCPLPPFLDVKSANEVTRHLEALHRNERRRIALGEASKQYFDIYNGRGASARWLSLATNATV